MEREAILILMHVIATNTVFSFAEVIYHKASNFSSNLAKIFTKNPSFFASPESRTIKGFALVAQGI
jgi:hypothetical protein